MRHRLLMFLVNAALLGVVYGSWAIHRSSLSVLIGDSQFPRPYPYPDQGLVGLNSGTTPGILLYLTRSSCTASGIEFERPSA